MIRTGQKFKLMSEKIDTQGMSGEAVEGCKDNVYPLDADGNPIYREDGKVMKGPNYFKPDIKGAMDNALMELEA